MRLCRTIKQPFWQQITDQRTKKNRDLDHARAMGMDRARVGGSTDALSSYVWQNRHDMSTDQNGYGGVPGWCLDPAVIWSEDCFYYCSERNNVVVLFGTLKVQSFILTEVSDCGLLIVVTSSTFLKREDMFKEKSG